MNQQLIELEKKERDINKLSKEVKEINDLFTDKPLLVLYQRNELDNIKNNIYQTRKYPKS